MKWRLTSFACILTAATTLHFSAYALSADMTSQISTLEREQAALTQQVAAKEKQIEVLRSRPSPEQKEVADARRAVDEARAAYKSDANAANEAKLKNAEFKTTLAERKYDKANADVAALRAESENLKQQIASKQRQLKSLQIQAAEQAAPAAAAPRVVEDSSRQKQQDQELERTRKQNETAQKEIERLKALLATKEAANNAAPATPAPAAVTTATTAATTAAAPVATSPAVNAPAADSAGGAHQLTTSGEVVNALQALASRSASSTRRGKDTNEIAYFKLQGGSGNGMVSLKALGNAQYRGETKLSAGNYEIVLRTNRWKTTLSGIAADTTFIVLLDNSNPAQPKMSYYNAALEGK